MLAYPVLPHRILESVVEFGRLLRANGIRLSPQSVSDAVCAMNAVGVEERRDVRVALRSVLVNRRDQLVLFDTLFDRFWDGTRAREENTLGTPPNPMETGKALDAEESGPGSITYSPHRRLTHKDFEAMSEEELAAARSVMRTLELMPPPRVTRRVKPAWEGHRIDLRRTLRQAAVGTDRLWELERLRHRQRIPPLIVLLDVSKSMQRYASVLLYLFHHLCKHSDGVHVFLFGVDLVHVTRNLKQARSTEGFLHTLSQSNSWLAGTRIGACLQDFNRLWARRVLSDNRSSVLLITDGLDRDNLQSLDRAMRRLHQSCDRLLWLNPLLRYKEFEPRAGGIRTILPHVDAHIPMHNLASLFAVARMLRQCGHPQSLNMLRA